MVLRRNPKDADAKANRAILCLKQGEMQHEVKYLTNAVEDTGFGEVLGSMNMGKGNFDLEQENCGTWNSSSGALTQLLNKDYATAKATLGNVKHPDAMTSYLHAIVSARQGNNYAAQSYLKEALQKDPSLTDYAANDLEFSAVKNNE